MDPEVRTTFATSMHTWWFNIRNNGGMRLTAIGYRVFSEQLDIASYDYTIDDPHEINQQLILALDRKIQTPYYIQAVKGIPKKVVFFGSKEAVLANLYGDLKKFLDNYN